MPNEDIVYIDVKGIEMKEINKTYILDVEGFEDIELFRVWYDRMDDVRKKKIDAFKPESSKRLSLGAGVIIKYALAQVSKIAGEVGDADAVGEADAVGDADNADDAAASLEYGPQGKPFIKGREDLYFNVSHSGSKVFLGISDKEIGVDIERNKEFKDSLVNYVFGEGDKKCAESTADPINKAYTRLWTVKESIMKHSGKGISLAPKSIELNLDGKEIIAKSQDYDCTNLNLTSFEVEDYQMTVCSEYADFAYPVDITGEIGKIYP